MRAEESMMLSNISVSRFLVLVGFAMAVTLGGLAFANRTALDTLKIGSPLYSKIVLGKDLIADILPPPEYILVSYLEATLALNDPGKVAIHAKRLEQLKKEYDTRHEFWLTADFDKSVQEQLTKAAHDPANRFFEILTASFLPALSSGDIDGAKVAYHQLQAAYPADRTVIDAIVANTSKVNAISKSRLRRTTHISPVQIWLQAFQPC